MEHSGFDSERCLKSTRFKFIVYAPELEQVKLSGSGNMEVSEGFMPRDMSFEVAGSGKITAGSVSALKVTARLSGSGRLELDGRCQTFDLQLSGSGMIRAFALVCNTANANLSGSGGIEAFVSNILNANISGSGIIRYKGDAAVKCCGQRVRESIKSTIGAVIWMSKLIRLLRQDVL